MQHLQDQLIKFFKNQNYRGEPLLLALSGGPDSTALFHLLLEIRQRLEVDFHVAHIDHGWREESGNEAKIIQALCEEQGIKVDIKHLVMSGISDLEAKAREARLAFYEELFATCSYRAVLLAHQADDLAETVLKRLFEGAALYHLGGMKSVKEINGITLWRPLLTVPKKELLKYLEKKEISYFIDPTNSDPKFLRAKMREKLIPQLSTLFGKQIGPALARIANQAEELEEFVQAIAKPEEGEFQNFSKTDFEWKWRVKTFLAKMKIILSASTLETVVYHLKNKSPMVEIVTKKRSFWCEKGKLRF